MRDVRSFVERVFTSWKLLTLVKVENKPEEKAKVLKNKPYSLVHLFWIICPSVSDDAFNFQINSG